MPAYLYILRLKSGQLYIGSTADLKQRYQDHLSGQACGTTKLDPPIKLVYSETLPTFSDARIREAQVKRWPRAQKEAFVA
jgi:putative endonuclease